MVYAQGVGVALTPDMYEHVVDPNSNEFDFLEINPDAFNLTSQVVESLASLAADYPITLHSTDLSICGDQPLSTERMAKIQQLADIVGCELYSDHLSYTWAGEANLELYMPPPFETALIEHLRMRLAVVREFVSGVIALENVGMLVAQPHAELTETDFIARVCADLGVSLQLNLDSVAISAATLRLDPLEYLTAFPMDAVELITAVPENSMNPVLRELYGGGINDLMFTMLDYALRNCPADRMMVQGRRGDDPEQFLRFFGRARETYYAVREVPANAAV